MKCRGLISLLVITSHIALVGCATTYVESPEYPKAVESKAIEKKSVSLLHYYSQGSLLVDAESAKKLLLENPISAENASKSKAWQKTANYSYLFSLLALVAAAFTSDNEARKGLGIATLGFVGFSGFAAWKSKSLETDAIDDFNKSINTKKPVVGVIYEF